MRDRHDPDPRFLEHLEWQLGRELRRGRSAAGMTRQGVRVLKIAGLMLGSVALGAAGMGASQQLSEAWRKELLQARLEVQLEQARQRVRMQQETLQLARERVEEGTQEERELMYLEFQIAQAEADAKATELELAEVRNSGREPLGELSSPLVDGRDYVSDRIRVRMDVARRYLDIVRQEQSRTRQMVDAGMVDERELQARSLAALEAELQLEAMRRQLELRRAYLRSEVSAVEAELQSLETEAQNRVTLLQRQLQYYQEELDRVRETVGASSSGAIALSRMETRLAEVEGQLRLANAELDIVSRELERRGNR